MTTADAPALHDPDSPLANVRGHVQLFTILFLEYFTGPPRRHVERALYTKACAFMRGLEALLRRALVLMAAAIIPTLALRAARPARAAAPRATPPAAKSEAVRPRTFQAFVQPPQGPPAARPKSTPRAAAPREASLADLRPLSRRLDALVHALNHPDAAAHRLAVRLRRLYTREAAPQVFGSPRLHPEHEAYLARDLDIWREDANEALRAALPKLVWPDSS